MFVPLHTRSYYSFLEGLASPLELAQAAAQAGMPDLALTDRVYLTGAIEFYLACQEQNVQPILGLELPVGSPLPEEDPSGDLVLLATSMQGWSSLCRLSSLILSPGPRNEGGTQSSRSIGEGFPQASLPFERLSAETARLICLTGGRRSLLNRLVEARQERLALEWLSRLAEVFPECLYVELQLHTPTDSRIVSRLADLAQRMHLPVVATHTIAYLTPEQAELARLTTAIRLNRSISEIREDEQPPPNAHLLNSRAMTDRFVEYPEAVATTLEIADRCQLKLPLGKPHFPDIPLPAGVTVQEVLRQKAEAGAQALYGRLTPEIQARLDHELAVISQSGYTPLFLVMEEILNYARQRGVPISSRGSAASSLVAHCLGITSPDPLRLNLYFERFLNPARTTPPDIDTDLCSRRRDEVIRYVYDHYGAERVAMVCTVNRFRRRSALHETAKAYGLLPAQVSTLVDLLPQRWWGPRSSVEGESPYTGIQGRFPAEPYASIFRDAAALVGLPRHLSIHPGGIVIAPGPLTDLAPTLMASKGVIITQFDLESIEALGLVKMDLLGIRGLSVLGDVSEALYLRNQSHYAGPPSVLETIPDHDPTTAELVRTGHTIGCFQIESPGMRTTLKEIQARSVDDVMVALALYRPGPLTGGLKEAFVRRHRGEEAATQLHPALEPLLADTYGVILYQEQVLRIAHELAGLSLADADLLRRAMSHFDPGEQMRTLKEKFIAGAAKLNSVPPEVSERIWQLMAAFAGYGFPKAHAASYAVVSWRAAWCKAHEPAIFMAAVLANWGGYYGQRVYLTEARRMGLALRPPHINYARNEFSISYLNGQPVLFMGLDQVRDLTRRTQVRIQQGRPFHSLEDFLARVDPRPVEAENLIQAGALEGFGTIPALLRQTGKTNWQGGQLPLFDMQAWGLAGEVEDWSLAEKMAAQEAVLGASVIAHPLNLAADAIRKAGAISTVEAAARVGQRSRVAGVRQTWRRSATEHGERIYLMSFEDLEGMLEVLIPGGIYQHYRDEISGEIPFLVEGEILVNPSTGEPFIRAERMVRLVS